MIKEQSVISHICKKKDLNSFYITTEGHYPSKKLCLIHSITVINFQITDTT